MLFKDKNMQVDYMVKPQVKYYLQDKLKKIIGHEYRVTTHMNQSQNWFEVTIDETIMTDKMYRDLEEFKDTYKLVNDQEVFSKVLQLQYGEQYRFEYLVVDSKGVYVIRIAYS